MTRVVALVAIAACWSGAVRVEPDPRKPPRPVQRKSCEQLEIIAGILPEQPDTSECNDQTEYDMYVWCNWQIAMADAAALRSWAGEAIDGCSP